MATILCFNFDAKALNKLRPLALRCGAALRAVPKDKYGETLQEILEGSGAASEPAGDFSERILVMCQMREAGMDAFLESLRRARLSAGVLKAVLTETNRGWDALRLRGELLAEREALQTGTRAHEGQAGE